MRSKRYDTHFELGALLVLNLRPEKLIATVWSVQRYFSGEVRWEPTDSGLRSYLADGTIERGTHTHPHSWFCNCQAAAWWSIITVAGLSGRFTSQRKAGNWPLGLANLAEGQRGGGVRGEWESFTTVFACHYCHLLDFSLNHMWSGPFSGPSYLTGKIEALSTVKFWILQDSPNYIVQQRHCSVFSQSFRNSNGVITIILQYSKFDYAFRSYNYAKVVVAYSQSIGTGTWNRQMQIGFNRSTCLLQSAVSCITKDATIWYRGCITRLSDHAMWSLLRVDPSVNTEHGDHDHGYIVHLPHLRSTVLYLIKNRGRILLLLLLLLLLLSHHQIDDSTDTLVFSEVRRTSVIVTFTRSRCTEKDGNFPNQEVD